MGEAQMGPKGGGESQTGDRPPCLPLEPPLLMTTTKCT